MSPHNFLVFKGTSPLVADTISSTPGDWKSGGNQTKWTVVALGSAFSKADSPAISKDTFPLSGSFTGKLHLVGEDCLSACRVGGHTHGQDLHTLSDSVQDGRCYFQSSKNGEERAGSVCVRQATSFKELFVAIFCIVEWALELVRRMLRPFGSISHET